MWFVLIFVSASFSALSMITMKLGVKQADPVLAAAIGSLVTLALSWIIAFAIGAADELSGIEPHMLGAFAVAGLATGGVSLANYGALKLGDVDTYVAVVRCSMVLSVVLSFALLGDPFSPAAGAGTALILIGSLLMIDRRSRTSGKAVSAMWVALVVIAIVLSSTATLVGKVAISDVNPILGTALFSVSVAALSNGLALATGKWRQVKELPRKEIAVILLAGAATAGMELTFYAGLRLQYTSIVMPVDKLLSGALTILLARLVFTERVNKRAALALAMVAVGSIAIMY